MTAVLSKTFKPRREDVVNLIASQREKKARVALSALRKEVDEIEEGSVKAERLLRKALREHFLKKRKGKLNNARTALEALGFVDVEITVQTILPGVLSYDVTRKLGSKTFTTLRLLETPLVVSVYITARKIDKKREAKGEEPWDRETTLKTQVEVDLAELPKKIQSHVVGYRSAAERLKEARRQLSEAQEEVANGGARTRAVKAAMTVSALKETDEGAEILTHLGTLGLIDKDALLLEAS